MRVLLLSTCPRPMKWNQGGADAEPPSASSDSLKTFQLPTFTPGVHVKKRKKKENGHEMLFLCPNTQLNPLLANPDVPVV